MASALTVEQVSAMGNRRIARGRIAFSGTYATGGQALAPADVGMSSFDICLVDPVVLGGSLAGFLAAYDYANGKVRLYDARPAAAGALAATVDVPAAGAAKVTVPAAVGAKVTVPAAAGAKVTVPAHSGSIPADAVAVLSDAAQPTVSIAEQADLPVTVPEQADLPVTVPEQADLPVTVPEQAGLAVNFSDQNATVARSPAAEVPNATAFGGGVTVTVRFVAIGQ